jgi:hypothetical protein
MTPTIPMAPLADVLRAYFESGATVADVLNAISEARPESAATEDETRGAIAQLAPERINIGSMIDANTLAERDSGGAWVLAWIWVPAEPEAT